jgi:hypothetical protein
MAPAACTVMLSPGTNGRLRKMDKPMTALVNNVCVARPMMSELAPAGAQTARAALRRVRPDRQQCRLTRSGFKLRVLAPEAPAMQT